MSAGTLGLVVLHACGGNSSGGSAGGGGAGTDAPGADCLANGTRAAIATNHGHVLVVSMDDVAMGAEKAYDIRGSADHTHTVTITTQQFASLGENQAIMMESSLNASPTFGTHEHTVMVACV